MKNVEVKVEGNKLVLTIDLTQTHGLSSSGKTTIVATTAGNSKVPGHESIQFGLNVFKKP